VVERRRDQARARLSPALGGQRALEGRLGARPQGPAEAQGGRSDQEAPDDLRQSGPAADRRLLRAVDLRLREADHRAALGFRPGGAGALAADRQGARQPEVGTELGRQPGWHLRADRAGPPGAWDRGSGQGNLRAGVHVLPAADLRALPEPLLRGLVPVRRDVQARRGRHRASRSGQVPGLALLRVGLPLQEGLLQPPDRQGREVHAVLPADRSRSAHRVLGDLRGADPLPGDRALRRRSG
jgi:hypothetical protein